MPEQVRKVIISDGDQELLFLLRNAFVSVRKLQTIFYKGIMPSEKILDLPVDCNFLTGSVNL